MAIIRLNGLLKEAQKSFCSCSGNVSGMDGRYSVVHGFAAKGGELATQPMRAAGPALYGAGVMLNV